MPRTKVRSYFLPLPVRLSERNVSTKQKPPSFALMEINLLLAKLLWCFDLVLEDEALDWEGSSHMHVMWWKPALWVKFRKRVEEREEERE